jgi:2-dehydro-3-deoxygluconokinase
LKRSRLVALLTPANAEACVRAYETLQPLGVVLEIGLRTDAALEGLAAVRKRDPEALLLAGTVLTAAQAEQAIAVGAAGIVSPDYLPPVVQTCAAQDVLCVPGGLGDVGKQLAQKAEIYGCAIDELRRRYPYQWVHKLFPAMAGAPGTLDMVAAWKAVYENLTVVYTGGVTADNLHEILRRDADAIICGSALTHQIDDAEATKAEAERWLAIIHGPRKTPAARQRRAATRRVRAGQTVVTFGEIMLRLSPPHGQRLTQATSFEACFGGAEANVAVALAQMGVRSRFVTAVPEHAIGQAAVNALRSLGVETRGVLRQGRRLGIYYLEPGAAQRPSQVIYDRADSSISELRPGQVDWEALLQDARWFHWSGITPALSANAARVLAEALAIAKRNGATVSVDLNYRVKLWSPQRAREVMTPLMDYVDIAIGNEEDAARIFGLRAGDSDAAAGQLDVAAYQAVTEGLIERFGLRMAAITLRESLSATENRWSACLHDGQRFLQSRQYMVHVVDRVGSGDAFAAGLIGALIAGKEAPAALEFAVAASCLKHSIRGDFNRVSVAEIEALAAGDASGRIRR